MNTQKQVPMTADVKAYVSVMEEIKHRTKVVSKLINQEINIMSKIIQTESMALQIRMIIESIALASLAANKSLFEQESNKFKKFWKAERIFEDIEKKNPDFYPYPMQVAPPIIPGGNAHILYYEQGFMTRDEIIKVHKQCCDLLHAKNPYAPQRDYDSFIAQVPNWINRINNLLNSHLIRPLNEDEFYIVRIGEDRINMYHFGPGPPISKTT